MGKIYARIIETKGLQFFKCERNDYFAETLCAGNNTLYMKESVKNHV